MLPGRMALGPLFSIPLAACFAAALVACAAHPTADRSTQKAGIEIDAAVPSSSSWTLLRLGTQRYARMQATREAWGDTGAFVSMPWRAIPSPEGAFRPVQAVAGARGYLYLLDAASNRLCLYDSAFGLISTYPLPERFTPFPAGRAAVFRGADGTFLFADYASGEAFLYTDREGTEGARAWVLRARSRMPVGWRECVQRPGDIEIACRVGGGAARFDGSLNRIGAGGVRAENGESRLIWNSATAEWVLEGLSSEGAPLFHLFPIRHRLEPVVFR